MDKPVARLQFGRHGVALSLEDAHACRVGVALVAQKRIGKAPGCALGCGARLGDGVSVGVISRIATRELVAKAGGVSPF